MLKILLSLFIMVCLYSGSSFSAENSKESIFPTGAYKIRAAQIDYKEDGSYQIYDPKQFFVEGRYEIDADTIIMTDVGGKYGCKGDDNPGRYHWTSSDSSITYKLIEDSCEARRKAMLESPFPRLGDIGFKLSQDNG